MDINRVVESMSGMKIPDITVSLCRDDPYMEVGAGCFDCEHCVHPLPTKTRRMNLGELSRWWMMKNRAEYCRTCRHGWAIVNASEVVMQLGEVCKECFYLTRASRHKRPKNYEFINHSKIGRLP